MRGADPAIFLVPGVGMFSFVPDSQTARVAGEFYVNAINVITGAETVSSYQPISDAEKFRVEYWDLEEEKLRRRPPSRPLSGRIAAVTGAASGIGKAIAARLHASSTTVMARGSFFGAKHSARVMIAQGTGGDIASIASKNALVAGPNNVAYGSAKASQVHKVRLLAAQLAAHDVRVNGVNPDAVVRGSGIFEGAWGRQRAEVYGVERSELREFYAQRTLLKKEVVREHIADAVFVLVGGELPRTTGHIIGVDGGLPAAFARWRS